MNALEPESAATGPADDVLAAVGPGASDSSEFGSQAPYPGLRHFRQDESDIFFGRETHVDELLEHLKQHRFLGIVGVSGCGKSSLIRAGMVPALETGLLARAGVHWTVVKMRPGSRPLHALSVELLAALPPAASGACDAPSAIAPDGDPEAAHFIDAALRRGPLGLRDVLRQHNFDPRVNLLVVVDQFEEIFRYRRDGFSNANEADAFVALLLASAAMPEFPVYVVLAMRSDYLGECALFSGLPEALNASQFLTPRLTRDQRRAAIEGPANVFGAEVAPALVNRLLNDMGADPDQLPLMQHLLMRMWEHVRAQRGGAPTLTLDDYDAVGGFAEALQRHVEEVFARLDPQQQRIAEVLFRAATERVENKQDSRRPVRLGEVAELAGVEWQRAADVVEAFRQKGTNFLLPPEHTPLDVDSIIDLTHESLIRQWSRLADWVRDEALRADRYRKLEADAREWNARDGSRAWLLRSGELDEALEWRTRVKPTATWAGRYGGGFDLVETFLGRSVWARRWRRLAIVGTVVGAMLLVAWLGFDAHQRRVDDEAAQQREEIARKEIAEKNRLDKENIGRAYELALQSAAVRNARLGMLETSTLLAVEAVKRHPSQQASQALLEDLRLLPPRPRVNVPPLDRHERLRDRSRAAHLAFAEKEDILLAVDGATVQRFDPAGEAQTINCPACAQGKVRAVDPYGRYLLVGAHNELRALDLNTGRPQGKPIRVSLADDDEVAIAHDGRSIAVRQGNEAFLYGSEGGRIARVSLTSDLGPTRLSLMSDAVYSVLDPTARHAATWTANGQYIVVKNLRTGATVFKWNIGALNLIDVVFSPNGRYVAAITLERVVRVWDVQRGFELVRFNLSTYPARLRGVAIASSGEHLAVTTDEAVRVFDIRERVPREVGRFEGVGEPRTMRFGPDDRSVAVLTSTGLRVWPLQDDARQFDLEGPVAAMALSRDKRFLATASTRSSDDEEETRDPGENDIAVWDVASGARIATSVARHDVTALRFLDSATLLVSDVAGDVGRLHFGPQALRGAGGSAVSIGQPTHLDCGPDSKVVAVSGDGQRIAVAGADQLCVYDGAQSVLTRDSHPADVAALSESGTLACAAGLEHRVHCFTPSQANPPAVHALDGATTDGAPVLALAVSDDQSAVAISTWRKGAYVMRRAAVSTPLRIPTGSRVESLALNRDASVLVTGGADPSARVWYLPQDGAARELTRIPLPGPVTAVALSADDELLITATGASVRVQPWRHLDLIAAACERIGRNLTNEEWDEYLPGVSYEETCGKVAEPPTIDLVQQGQDALLKGNIPKAVALYQRADAVERLSIDDWNLLCWRGALWGYAREVLFACEAAVTMAPTAVEVRDSRGLAFAMAGNRSAAISDFRFVVGAEASTLSDEERVQRRRWLNALEHGQRPFSLQELRALDRF